ncbi:MAG TPA: hypothetical protein VMP11_01340 [Verrucomicrobiae bacterium]|nr:hypothetical protein [Verrucomicrobiae bacterium]
MMIPRKQQNVFKVALAGLAGGLLAVASIAIASDPLEDVKRFSDFAAADLRHVLDGDILGARGSLMNFPNGLSAQTCFVTPEAAAETARRLQAWDPLPHETLNVFAYQSMRGPSATADFQGLNLDSNQGAIRWLLDKTRATTADKSDLNLTRAEAQQLANCARRSPDPQEIGVCWGEVLQERAAAFQRQGFDGLLPYEANGATVSPGKQLREMLRDQPAVSRQFATLLQRSGLFGNEPAGVLIPTLYWTLFEANHHATLSLGAIYVLPQGDHYQLLDVQYYVSGKYYVAATLSEIWPIQIGAKSEALVWRGDFVATPTLAFTKGTDRIIYGAILLQEIKKVVRCFQDDLKAIHRTAQSDSLRNN